MKILILLLFLISQFVFAKSIYVVGVNTDVDSSTAEDIISNGGTVNFASSAATTTIESTDTDDDGDPAGTGARTVLVVGLNDDNRLIEETVTLDGTSTVTLSNQYKAILPSLTKVLTAGSSAAPEGTLSFKHSSTVLLEIESGYNSPRSAFFTVPESGLGPWHIDQMNCSVTNGVVNTVEIELFTREENGLWIPRYGFALYGSIHPSEKIDFRPGLTVTPGTDIRISADAGADNTSVRCSFNVNNNPIHK